MPLKLPWVDTTRCERVRDCAAARACKHGAFEVRVGPDDEPGCARCVPRVDLERCKRCGECEKACPTGAVKMI